MDRYVIFAVGSPVGVLPTCDSWPACGLRI